ncbi:hypothetical protein D7X74_02305 [Corallococcus sp. CA047B]|uniref:hypothetical protein n=1 Tax=Corallococcus sp. CA047B TaxID=2316729 RepID=UPI000EA17FF1|nr:hypothetical protein [Corallococcus sp. CA047B]RKH21060.1 hypothetical protein D7X74_02305 [Corallococcus sp. CA047B]
MLPDTEQLMAIASHYWPASMKAALEEGNPEFVRRSSRWDEALQFIPQWHGFLADLDTLLPGFTVGDGTVPSQSSFRCIAYPAKGVPLPPVPWVVVGCVSILAPVFTVYGISFEYEGRKRREARLHQSPLPEAMAGTARLIAQELETRFGVQELPREVAAIPVPVTVQWTEPPQSTLFDALFDSEPTIVP